MESPRVILTRDGVEILRGSEMDAVRYIHQSHCYSVDHACKFEGYRISLVSQTGDEPK